MKHITISEGLRAALKNRTVNRAFFSTYCLEPDFFELEVLPLLLGSPALSTAEPLRYQQLQALMAGSGGRFAVAYDGPVFTPTQAARLEVDYLPLQVDGACHHAKLALIEVANDKAGPSLILCAGSFNLTKAGWWENIEVGHWVEIDASDAPSNILEPLRAALDWYLAQGRLPVLEALHALLAQWKPGPRHPGCSFYFSRPHEGAFTSFLAPVARGALEIVSPFFAEDYDNPRLAAFLQQFNGGVSMLLPRDVQQVATVTEQFHAGLGRHLRWCDWHAKSRQAFKLADAGVDERGYRKLHAKIYGGNDWLFVGSVNFSHQAMYANVEAGFLLTGLDRRALLGKDAAADRFATALALEAPGPQAGELAFPPVFLAYDWHAGRLEARCRDKGVLVLHDREGRELLQLALDGDPAWRDTPALREQLRHSSLVRACWRQDGQTSAARDLMVTQRQVYCRPSILPPLSLQDLLRILQDMHAASRAAAFGKLMALLQRSNGSAADSLEFLPPPPDAVMETTFFAEFSQVNSAFWHLKQRLRDYPAEQPYYLDGDQPDSLRGILRALDQPAAQADANPVLRYLTLLSMDELLAMHLRDGAPLADTVRARIAAVEASPAFAAIADKQAFLDWIKRIFVLSVPTHAQSHAEH